MCRKEINYIRMSQKEREQLHSEFSILSSLRHPNIVAYYQREHIKATQDLHLYMEYCGNGDLGRLIRQLKLTNQFAEEEFVWSVFAQLVTALYRCHYGTDPPELRKKVMAIGADIKATPVEGRRQVMILHRDLKPENGNLPLSPLLYDSRRALTSSVIVFLSEDNSVKLGDFGLSKIMQSHDFASTYVGTPYYMSPEVCASERYTLHSDIWSLGCIMYELCARTPPFTAKNHFQLVQRIKEGRYPPLPAIYSQELQAVIRSCLQVNPTNRPDTAQLLNLQIVKLIRKEKEVVELGKVLKAKEDVVERRLREGEEREIRMNAEQENIRTEIDAKLRREWEVKALLEIDRRVQAEIARLTNMFETEVQARVQMELNKQMHLQRMERDTSGPSSAESPKSSVQSREGSATSSTTVATDQSLDSPMSSRPGSQGQAIGTPSVVSQTMFVGSPMDVQMVDPSPLASLASLSLSPRRHGNTGGAYYKNIFAAAAAGRSHASAVTIHADTEDEDETPPLPSPTQQRAGNKPHTFQRPPLVTQKTAPIPRLNSLKGPSATNGEPKPQPAVLVPPSQLGHLSVEPDTATTQDNGGKSPNRRISIVPGKMISANETGSPIRRTKRTTGGINARQVGGEEMFKAVIKNNMMRGRSLLELAQARAGGKVGKVTEKGPTNIVKAAAPAGVVKLDSKAPEIVWDPAKDEMPSPFLVRGTRRAGEV